MFNEQMQRLVDKYRKAGNKWPATAKDMAVWMVREKHWEPPRDTVIARCAEDIAKALREEYYTDAQGRRVRTKHAARLRGGQQQMVMWDDIRTGARRHMEISFNQRREQVVGDCCQLKTDADSYNENGNPGPPVQLLLDFTNDVAEREAIRRRKSA